jgi:nitrogen fixation/metabolism regulation signal transduction histidine kinase
MRQRSIRGKVVTAITLLLLISVAVSIVIAVTNQRNAILDTQKRNLITSNDILNSVIQNLMLSGEAPLAVNTMEDLRQIQGFEQLELFRRDGTIAFSDYSTLEFVNSFQDRIMFDQTPRVETQRNTREVFQEVVSSNTPRYVENLDEQNIEYFFPILNHAKCRQCHGTENFTRGVAYYQISLDRTFQQISSSRNMLTLFFIATGIAIAMLLILLMQRIIINPLLEIGSVVSTVGSGNLDVQSRVKTKDELGSLSEKINSMITGLKEKSRLEIENSVIETKNSENKKYLDNINEGLLLIRRDGTISDQYSRYIGELFATDKIAGRRFSEFIYPGQPEDSDEHKELDQFISMIFQNTQTDMDMILSINPLSERNLQIKTPEGTKEIVVEVNFQRIFSANQVENVMAIFNDKTDIVQMQAELQQEKERSKSELEHIATLLKIGPDSFVEFEADARSTLEKLKEVLENPDANRNITAYMRDLHSLKGSARYLEFRRIADIAHETESLLLSIRDKVPAKNEDILQQLESRIEELRQELQNIRDMNEKFQSFAKITPESEAAEKSLHNFLNTIEKMIYDIADELGKAVEVEVHNEVNKIPQLPRLQNPIIHLVRNSLDHGIEESIERISLEKSEKAHLSINFTEKDRNIKIEIKDDGRGIDLERVKRKAVERNLLEPDKEYSEKELIKLLFKPDFSTKSEANQLSGRGVGLDAVYAEVKRLGGKIGIWTRMGSGTRFTITLPMEKNA